MARLGRSSAARCIYFLILFCILEQDLVSGALRGSCIDAGYTECCSNGCYGTPFACSCDPTCETYGDCCHDIYELCNPAVERAHNAHKPSVVYVENITFHTVAIHWIVTPGPTETINGTYEVSLYNGNSASNYSNSLEDALRSSVYSVPITVNVTEANREGRTFRILVADLDQDTAYTYRIGIISDVKTIENVHGGTFKTITYPSIEENVTLKLTADPDSVLVTWVNTDVPPGVNIVHFKVKYVTDAAQVGVVYTSSEQVSLMVEGLRTHQNYVFRVSVVIKETNGGLYEFGASESGTEIFVPDMADFQLVAKSSISCANWNMQGEQQVAHFLRSKLLNFIEETCHTITAFPEENLLNEAVIPLCENDSAIHVTYRASLIGIEECSSQELVDSIDVWRLSAREEPAAVSDISFQFSSKCPTRIDHLDIPLCMVAAEAPTCAGAATASDVVVADKSASRECPITTTMLVAYLLVEFGLLTILYLAIILATGYLVRMKRKLNKDSDHKTVENNYSVPSKIINRNSMSSQEEGEIRSHIRSETDESDLDQGKIGYML